MLPLFDEPSSFDRTGFATRLRALTQQGVWIGTSSWKYEGWLGQIYSRERYTVRGRFSQKRFEAECLAEYAETFPIVCGDFSFYQFPSDDYWKRLFGSAPSLQFALKAPDEALLNNTILEANFLRPLLPFRSRLAVLIFEFGSPHGRKPDFPAELEAFLTRLPDDFRYAVEIRNRELLTPDHFACLRSHRVAHVFNAWTRMPLLSQQLAIPDAFTADFSVTRALLRHGRLYDEAVRKFTPYDRIQEEDPATHDALRMTIQRAKEERRASYIFVNNRLEGNAPETIRAIISE